MDFFRKFFKKEKRPEEIEVNEDTKKKLKGKQFISITK
jgi:hypothetical protein